MSAASPLSGRHALITGAGGGIGAAIARALATPGLWSSLADRRREPLDAVAALLPAGAALVVDGFDVTDGKARADRRFAEGQFPTMSFDG